MNITCTPHDRCRKWKECNDCAKIRQAQIASVAEDGANKSRSITYAVVRPLTNDIAKQKTNVLKKIRNKVDGGIWTIETGDRTNGLHTNLILGSDEPIRAVDIAEALTTEASVYAEEILHEDVRNVAAYSSKPIGFPSPDEYSGRFYGSFGTFKRPLAALVEGNSNPIVKGLALEQMLKDANVQAEAPKPSPPIKGLMYPPMNKSIRETQEQVDKRLDHNEKVISEHKKEVFEHNKREYMKRLLMAHKEEIELKGYVYVSGFGLMGIDDLHKCGIYPSKKEIEKYT